MGDGPGARGFKIIPLPLWCVSLSHPLFGRTYCGGGEVRLEAGHQSFPLAEVGYEDPSEAMRDKAEHSSSCPKRPTLLQADDSDKHHEAQRA